MTWKEILAGPSSRSEYQASTHKSVALTQAPGCTLERTYSPTNSTEMWGAQWGEAEISFDWVSGQGLVMGEDERSLQNDEAVMDELQQNPIHFLSGMIIHEPIIHYSNQSLTNHAFTIHDPH